MTVKYPKKFFCRLSDEDWKRLDEISAKAEVPASTLARKVLRQWLKLAETDPNFKAG